MTAQPLLRLAERADIPAIITLLREDPLGVTREAMPDDPLYLHAFDTLAANPNNRFYVLECDSDIVGCSQLTFIPGLSRQGATRAIIEAVRVAKRERGAGLGTFLMEEMIRIASERGCQLIQLTSDKTRHDAHRFYERLGFTRSHEGFKRVVQEAKP